MYPSGQGNPTINPMGAGAPPAPSYQPMGAPGMSMLDVAEARLREVGGGGGLQYPNQSGNGMSLRQAEAAIHALAGQNAASSGMRSETSGAPAGNAVVPGSYNGGAVAANPTQAHTMPSLPGAPSGVSNAPSSPDTGTVMSPGATHTTSPSDQPGNAHHAGGPAVPGGASVVHAPSTVPGQGSPIASHSEIQPHPGFVHGGQAA